jgi:hypothetical protein
MPDGERVVLRTPWRVALVNAAPVFVLLMISLIPDPSLWGFIMFTAGFFAVALAYRHLYRAVLTPEGVELRWFGSRLVPWNHIGEVGRLSFLGNASVTVRDLTENRTRYLPSPQSVFGLGSRDVAAARALVEQWWIANRGPAPAVNPAGRTPPGVAGR